MSISPNNEVFLRFMRDIFEVSRACSTSTYIWGGFTLDILEGRFLREHHDLDGFTANLLEHLDGMRARYEELGYATEFRSDLGMLTIRSGGLHATFNSLEIDRETAIWRHIGKEGTVYFPRAWLDFVPRSFCGVQVFTAGIELAYALKTNVRMNHPNWALRAKDSEAIEHMDRIMARQGLEPEKFLKRVWSYNPYWAKRGYPQYAMPMVARPLRPSGAPSDVPLQEK